MTTDWCSHFQLPAWEHQLREWEHRDDKARMLRWQMRTGKTKAMIDLACYLYKEGKIDGVIVAGPNNVHLNWARKEVPKHIWDGVKYRSLAWDTSKSRNVAWARWFDNFCKPTGSLDFFMVNFEAFNQKRFLNEFLKRFTDSHKRYMLIIDETHDVRGPKSARSKELRRLRAKAVVRRGLSGTITDNSPLHAWSQYECLLEAALGYSSYQAFEDHFAQKELQTLFVKGRRVQVMQIVGYQHLDELTEAMAKMTSVVLRSECDDMPELLREEVRFELTPEQKRVYNALVQKAVARLDGGEVIPVKEGGALKNQLQQIASGWYVDEEGEVVEVVKDEDNPRIQALLSQLALTGPKTVVFCRYREDIVRVMRACKRANYLPVDYYGGTPKKQRAVNEDRFMNDPRFGPLIGQPLACGQGLDFSIADDIVWFSHLDGDLIKRKQADERATQKGGGRVFITDLVADGTGDDQLLLDLVEKDELSEEVSGAGLRRFLQLVH